MNRIDRTADSDDTHSRIRVLVVDDHPVIRRGYVMLFGQASGLVVVGEAADGDAAIEAFTRLRPDVTVLDLSMPRLSGWDVLTRIRQIDPDARVLIVSVCGDDADRRRARAAGALGYVLKECAADEVVAAVRAIAPPPRSEGYRST